MKTVKVLTILLMVFGLMLWHANVSKAEPMGTAFTYQCRLLDANGPSDGMYDFQFKLYDNANVIDGNQVGSDVNVPDVDVIDGYFTVVLEFGCDVFNGDARWLEIEVRQADSNDPNDFITLSPRQEVTPTPYALQTRGIFVDGIENVGIGTDIPFERLEVDNGNLLVQGIGSFDSDDEEAFVYLGDNNHYIKSGWGFGVSIGTWEVDPGIVVRETTGHVGIGTIDPQKNLSIQATRPQIALVENGGDAGILEFHEQENQLRLQYWTDYGSTWNTTMMTLDGDTGNVGIGTIDPGSRLDIKAASGYSDGGLRITSSINDNQVITLQDATPGDQGQITVKEGGTNKIILRANGDTYLNGGNVGIGTITPEKKLTIQSTRPQIALAESGGDTGVVEFHEETNQLRFQYWADYGATWMRDLMVLDGNTGNIGIGTRDPGSLLEIKAASGYSDGGFRIVSSTNNNQVITLQDATPGDQGQISIKAGGSDKIVLRANGNTYLNGGKVGIGTTNPVGKLDVHSTGSTINAWFDASIGQSILATNNSNTSPTVRIVNAGNAEALSVTGTTKVDVLEIMGADMAEKFPVHSKDEIKPGMVVAIDPDHPGELCLSRMTYNQCVAGVISGANNLPAGAILGNLADHEDGLPVALSGRVWVYCDAMEQQIEPGNLLTTAGRPGYAMAVSNFEKAHGAVIGKAMTRLEKGKTGLVLVLVNLQ